MCERDKWLPFGIPRACPSVSVGVSIILSQRRRHCCCSQRDEEEGSEEEEFTASSSYVKTQIKTNRMEAEAEALEGDGHVIANMGRVLGTVPTFQRQEVGMM